MSDWKSSTEALVSALQSSASPNQLDEASKARLRGLLDNVSTQIESPNQFLIDLTQSPNKFVAARIAIAMGIFDAFAANGGGPMSSDELDAKTKGEKVLLVRLLRILASYKLVEQIDAFTWKATPQGATLVSGAPPALITVHYYAHLKSYATLLEYLERTNFRNPTDYYSAPWGYAYDTEQGYFNWIAQGDSLRQQAFNTLMAVGQSFRGQDWFDFYPVNDLLKVEADRTVLVDIGGGTGHDVLAFRKKYPSLPGQIILQDLPNVIDMIEEPFPEGTDKQGYDAFTPQPVRNAKAYYMRNVLHDWPEVQALRMLKNVRDAMAPDSVLLINDNIMPENNISRMVTDVDFIVMNAFGSMERTEQQWQELLDKAGFKVVKVWKPTQPAVTPHALFEAVVR